MRRKFVDHDGKKTLQVNRPDFVLGQPNPWPEVFTSFSQQIGEHVGEELRAIVVADFSTTTDFHRAATEVALMDALQPYFDYKAACGCGIPAITLTGAPDDWRSIRRRAATLVQYELDEWVGSLLPVLDQIEASSRGHHDRAFWNSFFRYESFSGVGAMTGWIHVLFPYLRERGNRLGRLVPNRYIKTWELEQNSAVANASHQRQERKFANGPNLSEIPAGLASAPVQVDDLRTGQSHDMRFIAGMFGVSQDAATKALSVSYGWAVAYQNRRPPLAPRPPKN